MGLSSLTTLHHSQMGLVFGFVRILLPPFLSAIVANECGKPNVRHEWRKLLPLEQGDLISAGNVLTSAVPPFGLLTGNPQCLAGLPHDPKLVPSLPANVSPVPPVNPKTPPYDGMQ